MMRHVVCFAFAIGASALIAGCGGSTNAIIVPSAPAAVDAFTHHKTFHYTGNRQSFIVPSGIERLKIIAVGAMGGASSLSGRALAGRVYAVVSVTPKEQLYVFVGGAGSGQAGGFNGGASGGVWNKRGSGYGGGGASDVREGGDNLKDRIIVAGGGGGHGGIHDNRRQRYGIGGEGGTRIGGTGRDGYGQSGSHCGNYHEIISGQPDDGEAGGCGGTGGRQTRGGSGGNGGNGPYGSYGNAGDDGSFGEGGGGGSGFDGGGGGGAGGGYYGGGGGGGAARYGRSGHGGGGGGGGGSSFVELSALRLRMWSGWKTTNENGLVVISWQ